MRTITYFIIGIECLAAAVLLLLSVVFYYHNPLASLLMCVVALCGLGAGFLALLKVRSL